MPTKIYTAKELRQTAEMYFHATKLGLDDRPDLTDEIRAMLRQAADAEEELAELRDQVNRDFGESVSLRARLEAVVKEIESRDWINDGDLADAILRVARGDGGAE